MNAKKKRKNLSICILHVLKVTSFKLIPLNYYGYVKLLSDYTENVDYDDKNIRRIKMKGKLYQN